MSSYKTHLATIPTTSEEVIDVYVDYVPASKVLVLYVNPIKIEDRGGYKVTTYRMFSGARQVVGAGFSRISRKAILAAVEAARAAYPALVDQVCRKEGLTLAAA